MKRQPFQIRRVERQQYVAGYPQGYFVASSFRDWSAREHIAVEILAALIAGGELRHFDAARKDAYAALARESFEFADALIAEAKED